MSVSKGQLAYEDRARTGDKWDIIATRHGIKSMNSALLGARKYAMRNSLLWPIPSVKRQKKADADQAADIVRAAEDARLYRFIEQGGHYQEVEGLKATQVYSALSRHVERTGDPPLPRNPQRAYEMYRDAELSWKDVAKILGYRNVSNVQEAAASYAAASGSMWPLGSK